MATTPTRISGVARDSAARGGSRNCRPQMQWCTQDSAKGGKHNWGSGGEPPSCRRLRGSGDVANEFLRFSHKQTLFLTHFYRRKGMQ